MKAECNNFYYFSPQSHLRQIIVDVLRLTTAPAPPSLTPVFSRISWTAPACLNALEQEDCCFFDKLQARCFGS